MNVLVTGANGFVGRNLCAALDNLRTGKDRTRPALQIDALDRFDVDTDPALLPEYCRRADFVFNLAGVNRPKDEADFRRGNVDFASTLLSLLEESGKHAPVMLASSLQATLIGRYGEGEYGKSKKAGEDLFFAYGEKTGTPVLVYRFPNLFGKWCRPNYNSAVATFCNNIANDLPITVSDPAVSLTLLYIDDLVAEMLDALEGHPHRCRFDGLSPIPADGPFCYVPTTHEATLGEIVDLLRAFRRQSETLEMPEQPLGSFAHKLYAAYLSYLPKEKIAVPLKMNVDARGHFTELMRSHGCGQFSVNVSKPGIKKGEHWHNTKWEFFTVVSGRGRIEMRRVGSDEILVFDVSGDKMEAIHILPGYTHNIINLSDTQDLVTVMWANECFDKEHPDTFFEEVHLS